MIKYDIFTVKCVSETLISDYYSSVSEKYFVLRHGEKKENAQIMIQKFLKKCGENTLVISATSKPLDNFNTEDIPEPLISQMNGIYNLSK